MTRKSLWILALALSSSTAWAADLNPPTLPAGMLRLPEVRQQTNYSCGTASLLSILEYWLNYPGDEASLYGPLHTTPEDGTPPAKLVEVATQLGLQAALAEHMSMEDLRADLESGATVIVDLQAWSDEGETKPWKDRWEDGHYIVAGGMDSRYLYAMDPAVDPGHYGYLPLSELMERWHDYETVNGQRREYLQTGIVIRGGAPARTETKDLTLVPIE